MSFLYYTRVQGLASSTTGLTLTVVGLIAVAVAVPSGRLLERRNIATVNALLLLAQSAATAGLALVGPVVPLVILIGTIAVVTQVKLAARSAMLALGVEHSQRLRIRAWVRTVSNIGIGVGGGIAALLLAVDTRLSYSIALGAVALCYLLGIGPLLKARSLIPSHHQQDDTSARHRPSSALRDRRYVLVTLLSGIIGVHYLLLQVGLPLWILEDPLRPLWLVAVGLIVNTVVVAAGQVPLSRFVSNVRRACIAIAIAGICFFAASCVLASASLAPDSLLVALVIVAALLYSVGEILQATGSWELSFELAPQIRVTEYQSVFAGGLSLGIAVAPAVITTALVGAGDLGWTMLGGALLAIGFAHLALIKPRR